MTKFATAFILSLMCPATLTAQEERSVAMDTDAIKKATLNYLEGWYEGNADRMELALHPDLAKRGVQTVRTTGRTVLTHASASNMVEWTRAGYGKLKPGEEMNIQVTVLDIYENMASVKATSLKFIDYLHLARYNENWVIVNALWEPIKKPEEGTKE